MNLRGYVVAMLACAQLACAGEPLAPTPNGSTCTPTHGVAMHRLVRLGLLVATCGLTQQALAQGVTRVIVKPDSAVVELGVRVGLIATSYRGTKVTGNPASWTSRDTLVAPIIGTTSKGVVVVGRKPGSAWIVAVNGTGKDSAKVKVSTGIVVDSIAVTPDSVSVPAGRTQQFTSTATWSDSSTTPAEVTWSATGGTITTAGLYTAGTAAGTYRVVATSVQRFVDTAKVVITAAQVVSGEAAAKADSFVNSIGTNVHYTYTSTVYGNRPLIKSLLQSLGIKHLRDGGRSFNDRAWMTNMYGPMKDVALTLGVRFTMLAAPFGDVSVWSFTDTKGTDSVLKYIGRGDSSIIAFEGLNEWNTKRDLRPAWASEDTMFQHALWTRWHTTYGIVGPSVTRYVDACTIGNLTAWMHFGNMHPYPAGRPQTASLQANITNLACENGSRPLMATETGYQNALQSTSGNTAADETISGKYLGRLWFDTFNAGVVRTFNYELIDEGVSTTDAEKSFGLYRNDGTAKPAATVTKNLIALVSDTTSAFSPGTLSYTLTGDQTNLRHTLLAKADGTKILALWLDVTSTDTDLARSLTFTLGSSKTMTVYRPRTGTSAVQTVTGTSLPLTVRDEVILVKVAP